MKLKIKNLPKNFKVERLIIEGYGNEDWEALVEQYKNNCYNITPNLIELHNGKTLFKPIYPRQINGIVTMRTNNALFTPSNTDYEQSVICRPATKEMNSYGWTTRMVDTVITYKILI